MIEKYFAIEPERAHQLIDQAKAMQWSSCGHDRRAYLIGDYAVLSTEQMKLRNVTTRDDDLRYLNEIIEALLELHRDGVAVMPILGYCCDQESKDGTGFIIQRRARGQALYDDAILAKMQVWARKNPDSVYLQSDLSEAETVQYLLARSREIADIPQQHFDKLVSDMRRVLEKDILVDSFGKSNFFYDAAEGFQMIDLDAHNDAHYGLTEKPTDVELMTAICAFVPCLFAAGSRLFAGQALDEQALQSLSHTQQKQLAQANLAAFQRCIAALKNNAIADAALQRVLRMLKIYGAE